MPKSTEIRRSAVQELRALFSRATAWEESADFKVGTQTTDLMVKFKLGASEHKLAVKITSLGQPREIREAMTRLGEIRRDLPDVYPLAVSQYISPRTAALPKRTPFAIPTAPR